MAGDARIGIRHMPAAHLAPRHEVADGVAPADAVQHRDVVHRDDAEAGGDADAREEFGDQVADIVGAVRHGASRLLPVGPHCATGERVGYPWRMKRSPLARAPLTTSAATAPAVFRSTLASSQPWNSVPGVRMRKASPAIGCSGQGPAEVKGPRTRTASPSSTGAMVQSGPARRNARYRPGRVGQGGRLGRAVESGDGAGIGLDQQRVGLPAADGEGEDAAPGSQPAIGGGGQGEGHAVLVTTGSPAASRANSAVVALSGSSQRPARPCERRHVRYRVDAGRALDARIQQLMRQMVLSIPP